MAVLTALRSHLLLRAHAVSGATVLDVVAGHGQIVARQTGEGQVHLVGQAAGPLNGDELAVDVEVGAGARLSVASTAATIALPSDRDDDVSRIRVTATVGDDAELRWTPEPLVAAAGASVHAQTRLELAAMARVTYFDTVVLGRYGETGGRVRARLQVVRDGMLLLSQTTDTAILDRSRERVLATAVLVRPEPWPSGAVVVGEAVAMQPAPGILLATATAADHGGAAAALASVIGACRG